MRKLRIVWPLSFSVLFSGALPAFCAGSGSDGLSPSQPKANLFSARRGELTVWVSEPDHQPAPGVTVRVEQVSHEFLFGTAIRADIFSASAPVGPAYQETLRSNFNAVSTGLWLQWPQLQPAEKTFRWRDMEDILAWCAQQHLPVLGEEILAGGKFPAWTASLNSDDLSNAAGRFLEWLGLNSRLQVSFYEFLAYPLESDLFVTNNGEFAHKAAISLLTANPSALLYIGDLDLLTDAERCARMITLVQTLLSRGVPLNGLCVHARGSVSIDSDRVTACLNILGESGLPIFVTGVSLTARKPAEAVADLVVLLSAVFAHPAVSGFFFQDILPSETEPDRANLYNADLSPTECGLAYQHLYHQEWRTRTEGRTDDVGRFSCSAFFGEYLVSAVSPDGRRAETKARLSKEMGREIVALHMPPKLQHQPRHSPHAEQIPDGPDVPVSLF